MRKMVNIAWVMANFEMMDAVIKGETRAQCLARKTREVLKDTEFLNSVRTHGVVAPVGLDLTNKVFYNGLHRLIAAWLLDFTHIPFIEIRDDDADTLIATYGVEVEYVQAGFPVCQIKES